MVTTGVQQKQRVRPGTAVQRKNEMIKKSLVESYSGNKIKTTSIMKKTADHAMHNLLAQSHAT